MTSKSINCIDTITTNMLVDRDNEIMERTSIDMARQLALQAVEADRTSETKEE